MFLRQEIIDGSCRESVLKDQVVIGSCPAHMPCNQLAVCIQSRLVMNHVGRSIRTLGHIVLSGVYQLNRRLHFLGYHRSLDSKGAVQPSAESASHSGHHNVDLLFRQSENGFQGHFQEFRGLGRSEQFCLFRGDICIEIHWLHTVVRQVGGAVCALNDLSGPGKGCLRIPISSGRFSGCFCQ